MINCIYSKKQQGESQLKMKDMLSDSMTSKLQMVAKGYRVIPETANPTAIPVTSSITQVGKETAGNFNANVLRSRSKKAV